MLETIYWENNHTVFLDQTKLPNKIEYVYCNTPEQVAAAIKELQVRGAPLIGVAAAFGIVLAMKNYKPACGNIEDYYNYYHEMLAATRPTAVNLFWSLKRMKRVFNANLAYGYEQIFAGLLQEAQKMKDEDIKINKTIGENGKEVFKQKTNQIMTVCNAGALATCGYGTALGVIRKAHEMGMVNRIWACETRPVLQGARLTVWELCQDKIPVTLITDSMAAYVMKTGQVDAVITGADRVAANGDTANKIGTYALAILAHYHNIPFYIAAPSSTLDLDLSCGEEIPIEERDKDEVRTLGGISMSLPDVEVFNPAFDVTPHELITAIITEYGVITPPFKQGLNNILRDERS